MRTAKWIILGVYVVPFGAFLLLRVSFNADTDPFLAIATMMYSVLFLLGGSVGGTALAISDLRAHPELRTPGNLFVATAGIVALVGLTWVTFGFAFR